MRSRAPAVGRRSGVVAAVAVVLSACRPTPPADVPDPATSIAVAEASPDPVTEARTFRVDLSELPNERVHELANALGASRVAPARGEIIVDDAALESALERFVDATFVRHGLDAFDFYGPESYPRLAWWENVVVQLPEFVQLTPYERYSGYSAPRDTDHRLLAFVAVRLDRSPQQLRALYERHADAITRWVPPAVYERGGYGRFVRGLLASHAHIVAHPDYPEVMDQLDAQVAVFDATDMFSGGRTAASVALYDDVGLLAPELVREFRREGGGYTEHDALTDVVWLASFWLRRHREGNTDAVLDILRDIDRRYAAAR